MQLFTRRELLLASAAPLLGAGAAAQTGGQATASMLVTTPPGGPFDIAARRIQPDLAEALGQPIIVENVPGANGSLAAQRMLNEGGGLKMLVASPNEITLAPLMLRTVRYKPQDFRLLCVLTVGRLAVLVRPGLPATNLREMIEYAKRPGAQPLSYGSLGTGTLLHLVGVDFAKRMELKMTHVPYKGGASAVQDVVGNQIDIVFLPLTPSYIQMAKVGQLKVLGMLSPERNPAMPQVPAVDEIPQLRGFHYSMWAGLFVPARLPLEKAAAIGKATYEIVSSPNYRAWAEERGATAGTTKNLDEAAAYFERESQRFEKIAADVKIERE